MRVGAAPQRVDGPPRRRRLRWLGLVLAVAVLGGACAAGGSNTGGTTPQTVPAAAVCGGEKPHPKADGTPWTCTFDDEFQSGHVDRSSWTVDRTAFNGLHVGSACLVDDPRTVSVGDGVLRLRVVEIATPIVCASPKAPYRTRYLAGSVNTYGHFSQRYGRFEIRARFPAASVPGLQSSLWLFPVDVGANHYSTSGNTGELDIGEYYTQYPSLVIPYAHYLPATPTGLRTSTTCKVARPDRFHTYVLTWTSSRIQMAYDGVPCLTLDGWAPLPPSAMPAPFNGADLIALTQSVGVEGNVPTGTTPIPAEMQVDYVRVWK